MIMNIFGEVNLLHQFRKCIKMVQ